MHIGNSNISNLYIAINKNKIILIKSALIDFVEEIVKIDPTVKNRNYFSKYFEKNKIYYHQNPVTGEQYVFQKIENTK
tara:strand:- start:3561 stop:3794 length:234 start_codon:yes stop_codon:yes gene_type:complete